MVDSKYFSNNLRKFEELRSTVLTRAGKLQERHAWSPELDMRLIVFQRINNLLMPFNLSLLLGEQKVSDPFRLMEMIKPETPRDANFVVSAYEIFIRNGYIYSFSGIVDGTLRAFLRVLKPNSGATAEFSRTKAEFLGCFKTPLQKNQDEAINLLFAIRNCVHNNGIYFSRDLASKEIQYRNQSYKFEHGKVHSNASLAVLYKITSDILNFFEHVVCQKESLEIALFPSEGR